MALTSSALVACASDAEVSAPPQELAIASQSQPVIPAPDDYDIKVGVTLDFVSQVMAGLQETRVWPTSETIPDLGSYGMTALRGVLSGIPSATQAGDMTLGALRFTAPPTLHAVAGTHWPVVYQRFALDFVPPAGGTQPAVSLTGTLQLGIGIVSSVRPVQRSDGHWGSDIQITFGKIPQPPARVDAEKLHIVVDASSTVQFHSWDHSGIETILDNWFQSYLDKNSPSLSSMGPLSLPKGPTYRASIRMWVTGASTATAPSAPDALVIGGRFSPPAHGNLANLANPFAGVPDTSANLSLYLHENALRFMLHEAFESGVLQNELDQHPTDSQDGHRFIVKDVDVTMNNNVDARLSGFLENYCDTLWENGNLGVDVHAVATASIQSGKIAEKLDTNPGLNTHYGNEYCAVQTTIVKLPGWLWDHSGGALVGAIKSAFVGSPDGNNYYDATIGSGHRIPSTERRLNLTATTISIASGYATARWAASVPHDDTSSYIYARFVRSNPWVEAPLRNAAVTLMDQDSPEPAGDDVNLSLLPAGLTLTPTPDEQLATGTTDDAGLVRFVLEPNQMSTRAGTVSLIGTTTTIYEAHPDLYFKVQNPSGATDDTRAKYGIKLNAAGNHLGTISDPLVYNLPDASFSVPDVSGDFDGDGYADVMTLYDYGNASAGLFIFPGGQGNTVGTTKPYRVWYGGPNSFDVKAAKVTAGDFNHDGYTDVLALYDYAAGFGWASAGLWVFPGGPGKTEGSCTPYRVYFAKSGSFNVPWTKVSAGDFNGDGYADVLALYDYTNAYGWAAAGLFVFPGGPGRTDGSSTPYQIWYGPPGSFNVDWAKVTAGDFDGDGKADLLALYNYNTAIGWAAAGVFVFPGTASRVQGATAPYQAWYGGAGSYDVDWAKVTAGDFDGDGKADLMTLYNYDGAYGWASAGLIVFPGAAARTANATAPYQAWFVKPSSFEVDWSKVTAGDFNHDNKADLLALYSYNAWDSSELFVFPGASSHAQGATTPYNTWFAGPGSFTGTGP